MPLSEEDENLLENTLNSVSLTNSTGYSQVDQIIQGVIGIFERIFPDRIRSYYLVGSYANGTAISTSDLDIHPLFKGGYSKKERSKARQIGWLCDLMTPIELGISPKDDRQPVGYNGIFKLIGRLVYGEEVRDTFPIPSVDEYIRNCMNVINQKDIRDREVLIYPLDFPDPEGEFFGYDQREVYSLNGAQYPKGTKDLIALLYQIIIPIVAIETHSYVLGKSEAFQLYRDHINDAWADFLTDIWETCRTQWEYCIPEEAHAKQKLRSICEKVLELENHYLLIYRDFWLKKLNDTSSLPQALFRFTDVIYPDDEVLNALKAFEHSNERWMHIASDTIERIEQKR